MDLGKLQYFEKVESSQQEDFLNAQNNCLLCGSHLDLQHIWVGEETSHIKEEARCPHCDLRTRAKTFSVQ